MYKILSNILLSRLTPYAEENMGNISVDFDATGQLLIIHSAFIKYVRKEWEYNEAMQQLFIDFKKAYDSFRGEDLYNILIKKFGISMKLLRLIEMCLNETYSRVHEGKHLSDMFPIKNGLKQGDALSPTIAFQRCLLHVTFFATLSSVLSC
jgi:hypothetical protein